LAIVRKRGSTWQIDYFDPFGKRIRKSFSKKKEAEAELAKRVSLIAEGRYLDVKKDFKTTFGELLARYEENYQHQKSFIGFKRSCLERFREHFGEDTLLVRIRYYDLERYRNHLRLKPTRSGTKRKDATIRSEMSCLHHVFTKAQEWEMIETSPFARGKSLLEKVNNQRLRFLTEEEIPQLIEACPNHVRKVVVCALLTGMRRGEILSLQWSQIRNGFIYLQKTKTNESRQIPISDDLAKLFREIRKEQELRSQYVFTYATGEEKLVGINPINKRKKPAPVPDRFKELKKSFKRATEEAEIFDFRFHDLRHTFASQMIMHGASLKDVQEILGHKTMTMTLRYAHLSSEHKKKAINLINGLTASPQGCDSRHVTNCHKMT